MQREKKSLVISLQSICENELDTDDASSSSSDDSFTSDDLDFDESDFDFAVSPKAARALQSYMTYLREIKVLHCPQPFDAQRRYTRDGCVVPVFMQTRKPDSSLSEDTQSIQAEQRRLQSLILSYGGVYAIPSVTKKSWSKQH